MNLRFVATVAVLGAAVPAFAADKTELKEQKEKVSYSIGMNWGNTLKVNGIEVDFETLLQGMRDKSTGKTTLLTDAEAQAVMQQFQTEHRAQQETKRVEQVKVNREAGEKFLAENKTKPGVVALPSGLQYKVLTEGSGAMPGTNDTVMAHYRGTLIDGTEFDSSYKRGTNAASFGLGAVIKGWTEGVSKMKKGAKWQLFVPPDLAYGDTARPGSPIPGGSTLIFEVELQDFIPYTPPPMPGVTATPVTSDIIKVPSKEEMEKGAKIEVIKPEDLEKLQKANQPATK